MVNTNDTVFAPVLPSFDGFFQSLSKNATKGGQQAGQDMATAMEKSLKQAEKRVDSLAKSQERAQNRAADAADKTRIAQLKLAEAMEDTATPASKLADLTAKYEKAQRDEVASTKAAEKAAKDLSKAKSDLTKSTNEADDAFESGAGSIDDFGENAKNAAGNVAGLVGQLAGIGTLAGGALAGWDMSKDVARINNQLGLVGPAAASVGDEIADVMRTGVVGSSEEAAEAVGALHSQFGYLGSEGEQTAAELSDNFLAFTSTFEVGMAEATQTAGQLVKNGLAGDVEEAADLMTAAMQRVPAAMRDELPEIINEYGVNFKGLGFSGEEAFGMLVTQAENGKWALDKTGDALKEFQIRGSDMSKASVAAYDLLGLSAEEMSSKIATGGEGAREALTQVSQGILGIEDPAERANAAIALFGTPLEDLGVDQIPAFLEGLSGADSAMADFSGSSEQLADTIENSLGGRLNALKGTAQGLAEDGFMYLWDKGQELANWAKENSAWLTPLVVGLGTLAGVIGVTAAAMATWTAIKGAYSTATDIATGKTLLFNNALKTNIIIAVVAAIAALVAGLVYFFTQTETGQQIWDSFTSALAAGWDWVVEKLTAGWEWIKTSVWDPFMGFLTGTILPIWNTVWGGIQAGWDGFVSGLQWAWESIIQPVFNAFVTAGKVLFAVLATAVLAPLQIAWNALSSGIQWGWQNLILPAWQNLQSFASFMWTNVLQPVFGWIQTGWNLLATGVQWYWQNVILVAWTALQTAAQWMWTNVLMPVFNFITNAWNLLATGIQWYWQNVIMVAWQALQTAAQWMWTNVLQPVFNFITTAWQALGDGIRWVYDNIIKPAWDALGNALNWLYETIIQPVLQWIGDRWNDMSAVLEAGRAFIVDTVFGGLQRGLEIVQDAFQLAKDGIARIWDGVRAAAAKPVKFVIDTIFNNGIVTAWNKVADWVGLDPIEEYKPAWLGDFHSGTDTIVPGPRSVGRDNMRFISTDGQYGISLAGNEGIAHQGVVDAFGRKNWDRMNAASVNGGAGAVRKELGSFATGGIVQAGAYLTTDVQRSMWDAVRGAFPSAQLSSGTRNGGGGDFHDQGLAIDLGGGWASDLQGIANWIASGYPHATELFWDPGPNIDEGIPIGAIGGHSDHVHWAMREIVDPYTGEVISGGGGGGIIGGLRNMVANAMGAILDPIESSIPEFPGMIGGLPKAAFGKMSDAITNFIRGKADSAGAYSGPVGGGVERWRGLVEQLLETKGYPTTLADTVLRRMDQESTGDPTAINNWDSNAKAGWPTKGLMQMRDDTFITNADPGYTDIWSPEDNIRSSFNYTTDRYGSLPAGYNRAGGYHLGGLAPAGEGMLHKTAMEPEMVLSPAMTDAFIEWMRGTPQGESAAVVAKELAEAFRGGDWGYGELASYIGEDIAKAAVDVVAAVGRADRGFRDWARATEDQDRMGTPEEWARHYGAQAGAEYGAEALGLLGLESLAGHQFRDSLVDLVNEAVPYANQGLADHDVHGFRFGPMAADMWQPVEVIDDQGRVPGTQLEAVEETSVDIAEPETVDVAAPEDTIADSVAASTAQIAQTDTASREIVIQVEGDAVSTATLQKVFDENREELGDLKIRVEKVEGELDANVTSGITGIV